METMMERRIRHHIVNRCDGGSHYEENLLLLWKYKEQQFHDLFGNRTLYQAARLLLRVHRAKKRQGVNRGKRTENSA